MGAYRLAVDIGASSGRVMAGKISGTGIDLQEVYRFDNQAQLMGGHYCWDVDRLFREIKHGIRVAVQSGLQPVSIGINTWAVDFVLLDEKGERLTDAVSYRDPRTNGVMEDVIETYGKKALYERTGIAFQPFNTLYQLLALKKQNPELLEQAHAFLMVPDYFHYLLTGVKVNEYTNATTTQLVNVNTKDWDRQLLKDIGLPCGIFQPLQQPGTKIGSITESMEKELGVHLEVIVPATHDTASAIAALPEKQTSVYISSGTWSLIGIENRTPICSQQAMAANFTNEGGVGSRVRFLKNIMGLWMIQEVQRLLPGHWSFSQLAQAASESTYTGEIDVDQHRFLKPESMIEEIQQACREKGLAVPDSPGDLAKCIYDSLIASYDKAVTEIEAISGKTYEQIHIIGGGALNKEINQRLANRTNKTVIAGPTEATAVGNLLVQAIADEELSRIEEGRALVRTAFPVTYYLPQRSEWRVTSRFESAKVQYEQLGIDVEAAFAKVKQVPISVHCWQGDDLHGTEVIANELSGGIDVTGNHPGRARNGEELRRDLEKALSLIPGKHRVNLHAMYAETDGVPIERDQLKPEHFEKWVKWAKLLGIGLDFNPTVFSHPKAADGLTLAHPDEEIRTFWINHCKACRKIAAYFGEQLGTPSLVNIWVPDGYKDTPSDRLTPRKRLKESLDAIYADEYDPMLVLDTVESKLFGIGSEAYVVGSHEFYLNYANQNNKLYLLDTGHFHPTEVVSNKLSAMLLFHDQLALHVSRPVRWDSDHVVTFDDELREIAIEIVRNDALGNIHIGLDFFDASINRVAAWAIGTRNMAKALLHAALMPHRHLKQLQDEGDFTSRLAMQEQLKTYPFGDMWDEYCKRQGVPTETEWLDVVKEYEQQVQLKREGEKARQR